MHKIILEFYGDIVTAFALISTILVVIFNAQSVRKSQRSGFQEMWMERIRDIFREFSSEIHNCNGVLKQIESIENNKVIVISKEQKNILLSNLYIERNKSISNLAGILEKIKLYYRSNSRTFNSISPKITKLIKEIGDTTPSDLVERSDEVLDIIKADLESKWNDINGAALPSYAWVIVGVILAFATSSLLIFTKDYASIAERLNKTLIMNEAMSNSSKIQQKAIDSLNAKIEAMGRNEPSFEQEPINKAEK